MHQTQSPLPDYPRDRRADLAENLDSVRAGIKEEYCRR